MATIATKDSLPLPPLFASIPKSSFLFGPSPIHELTRISDALGGEEKGKGKGKVRIWAKREDCNSGIAFGGNKVRKLEYLIPEALAQGCDTLISIGGIQSNHTRAVAGVASKIGLKAKLIQENWVNYTDPVYSKVGNIQISRLMGAIPKLDPSTFGIGHKETLLNLTKEVEAEGGKPYYIPAGASDHPLGGLGFARWAFEVVEQEKELGVFFGTVVVCAVTGSTFGGMIAGFKLIEKLGGRKRKVIGIDASAKPDETRAQVLRIARFTGVKIGLDEEDIMEEDVVLDERWHDGAYGIPGEETLEVIRWAARTEAFITDPVYEGKSLRGLVEMVKLGEVEEGENVLYVHLGGQLALGAYSEMFAQG